MGLFIDNEKIIQRNASLVGSEPAGFFTSVTKDLNSAVQKSSWWSGGDLNSGPADHRSSALQSLWHAAVRYPRPSELFRYFCPIKKQALRKVTHYKRAFICINRVRWLSAVGKLELLS